MDLLRQATAYTLVACLGSGLAACGNENIAQPATDFFHSIEGGVIAQQRPPPPGVDDPYPNLGTIPPRPPAPDIAAQQALADQLAAQRDNAAATAAKSPVTVIAKAPPPPKPQPPDANGNRVVVDAAASPAPNAPSAATAAGRLADVPPVPPAVESGPLPSLAAAPPPLPTGLGVEFAASIPPPPIQASPPKPPPPDGNAVSVAFTPGSATLPPSATLNLRRFALAHRGAALTVIGHGEAIQSSIDAQARALELALHRAQAIAASLAQAGVPAANVRLRAEAAGQGGSATL